MNALMNLLHKGRVKPLKINGRFYVDRKLHCIEQPLPVPLEVRSLSGLVDYVRDDFDQQLPLLIHVASPTLVQLQGTFNSDMNRPILMNCTAMLPKIPYGTFLDIEQFNILLQSCFVDNDRRKDVLRVVGNIMEENVMNVGDDGVSQVVTAKAGIATVGNVPVPNPVYLKPFRSFVEIEQPESAFVFRMQKGPVAALFEADGGAWKLDAMDRIKEYMNNALAEEITEEKITIIA